MASPLRWGALRTVAAQSAAHSAATAAAGGPSVGVRLASLPRLLSAVARGEYLGLSKARLALMVAALAYVVSPADFVPEAFVALAGLGDDAMITAWLAMTIHRESEDFLRWEADRTAGAGRATS